MNLNMTHDPQNKQILDFGVHGESKIYTDLITISTSYNLLALGRTKYFFKKKHLLTMLKLQNQTS